MGTIDDSPLGKSTQYPDEYDAALLYAVERAPQRASLGVGDALPFTGHDRWTVWEAAWLDDVRRPRTAIVTFSVPCASPRIVESKSVKLYFASLNHATLATPRDAEALLRRDLSQATGSDVDVAIDMPERWSAHARADPAGIVIDDVVPADFPEAPDAACLHAVDAAEVDETLVFNGFRSVCPVTGQPDYATVRIAYRGAPIERAALAAYLFGYRRHPGFHEHCVERMFADVAARCRPSALCVDARFTRRGGVDINPVRASDVRLIPRFRPALRQ